MTDRWKETWHQFIKGNHEALNDLYKQHYLGLINYGIKLTGNRQYANDCITEMLLGLWERRNKLPEVDNVRSYLMSCLRTTIFQKFRSEKLRESKESFAHSLIAREELPYDEYITTLQTDKIIKERLQQSLNKLTGRQKELLQYRFFENMDYDEIALKCGISKRTAYNIIYDALQKLKADLSKDGNSDYLYSMLLFFINFIAIDHFCR